MDTEGNPFLLNASPPAPPSRKRLEGYLKATAIADEDGQTRLDRKAYRTPIHISKPYWDGSCLLLNVMSPTAGLLEGDRVDVDVNTLSGASLSISNPTALRIHKTNTDTSSWTQRFHVESGGFLEVNPEWTILQAESRFEQRTRIELDPGGRLFFIEAIAPGRIAHGECFTFHSFKNRFELLYDNQLAALERSAIEPAKETHSGWNIAFEQPFFISIFLSAPELESDDSLFQYLHEQQTDTLLCGCSRLQRGPCWNLKILSPNPIEAKSTLKRIRDQYYRAIHRTPVDLRR